VCTRDAARPIGSRSSIAVRIFFIYARDRARSNATRRSRRAEYERGARTIAATDRGRICGQRSRRRAAFLHTRISTMSALLASSFVGRVAAFKATKIQVRIF